jgi:hypothetical protein
MRLVEASQPRCPFPNSQCQTPVYHGTSNPNFKRFSSKGGLGGAMGFWFATTREAANTFAKPRYAGVQPGVKVCWINIQQPMEYDGHAAFVAAALAMNKGTPEENAKALRRKLARAGHDGVVIRNSDTDMAGLRDDWVAFHSTQIEPMRQLDEADDDDDDRPRHIRDLLIEKK